VPFLSELTEIYPPSASTKDFEVERPTPIPDVSPPSYLSPDFRMENVSNRPAILFAGIPFPKSVITVVSYPTPYWESSFSDFTEFSSFS
jgi:hypothetical protein